ncbi:MAG: hypothetical protein WC820_03915 [Spirochaetales bacterium]
MIRKIFFWTTIASIALMALSLALLAANNVLRLDQASSRLIFQCLCVSAFGFSLSSAAHFFLDIMYGILGLLQVKVAGLIAWLALSFISLAPLAAIFAFMRLASGFQA